MPETENFDIKCCVVEQNKKDFFGSTTQSSTNKFLIKNLGEKEFVTKSEQK